jgi:hypothetical protein
MRVFPYAVPACGPMHGASAEWTLRVMNHVEKRPLGNPRPENELAALLWVIAALLACLDAVWWLGNHLYS